MSINVYTFDDKAVISPLEISEMYDAELEINLLLYKQGDNSHYRFIKDLSKLVGSELSKNEKKKYLCRRCLSHFYSNEDLNNHLRIWKTHKPINW